jgi:elongation factor Ts
MDVSVESLKALRETTGAGMMDCRKALLGAGGDFEAAKALISEWGLATAVSRADRETREGRIGLSADATAVGLSVLACETDFVSRNALFISAANGIAAEAREHLLTSPNVAAESIVADMALRMKERIVLKGLAFLKTDTGEYLDTYLHGEGSIGVAVKVRAKDPACFDDPDVRAPIHDLCLQIAARAPLYLEIGQMPEAAFEEKRQEILAEIDSDSALSGKGVALKEKVIAGRLRKYISTVCLSEQAFVKDESLSVGAFLDALRKKAGTSLEITGFIRLAVKDDEE